MKKTSIIAKVAILIIFSCSVFSTPTNAQSTNTGLATTVPFIGGNVCDTLPWQLVFHDEFSGTTVDDRKWHKYFPYGPNNSDSCLFCRTHTSEINSDAEVQVFKDENIVINDGIAKFILRNDNPTWMGAKRPFSAGVLYSKANVFEFRKGKFEIRCKIPRRAKGLWPSFWMFGYDRASDCNRELDVFEFRGTKTDKMEMSLHKWFPGGPFTYSDTYSGLDYGLAFHTFALEWDNNVVTWLIDDVVVNQIFRLAHKKNTILGLIKTKTRVNDCTYNAGQYLQPDWFPTDGKVNVIVGLGIGKEALQDLGSYPTQMEVDYIRVYQRTPEPSFPPLCALQGNDVMRTGENSTFRLPEDFGAVTWSVSPNLDIISSDNTSIIVSPKPAASGEAFVTANFVQSSACGTTSTTKKIRIGNNP